MANEANILSGYQYSVEKSLKVLNIMSKYFRVFLFVWSIEYYSVKLLETGKVALG